MMHATAQWRRVRVYVAGSTAPGVPLRASTWAGWVSEFVRVLARASGDGVTVYPPVEGWWAGDVERTRIVEALMPEDEWASPAWRRLFDRTVQRYLAETCQSTALVVAEKLDADEVRFVEAHDSEGVVSDVG